jgi:DNA-directed RNA polymerase subunit E"
MFRSVVKEFACRKCQALTTGRVCPNDGSTELSPDWSGLVIVLAPEKSNISKTLNFQKPGRYALKVA